jgi:GT2 family glycosyltransferase
VSIVVPAHGDRAHLARLLPALARGLESHGVIGEIIVAANGPDGGMADVCRRFDALCLSHANPLTPAAARNRGVQRAKAEWLVFLDADVEPLDSWFAALRRVIERGERDDVSGWEVLVPAGSGWLPVAWQNVRMAAARTQRYVNTGNLIISRVLFERAHGFDEERAAGEDAEFGERIVAAGGRHRFDPELAVVHHGEPRSLREFFKRQLFHAEPLREVVRALGAPLNLGICLILCATIGGLLAARAVWQGAAAYGLAAMLLGPAVLLAVAVSKAAAGWTRAISPAEFGRMVGVCAVMLLARTVGTLWQRRSWRS